MLAVASPVAHAHEHGDDLIACRTENAIEVLKDRWIKINPPLMDRSEGGPSFTAFTTIPGTPERMYMTNGTVLKRTADAGCTWEYMRLSSSIEAAAGYEADIFTHLAAPDPDQLWVASYDDASGVERPHVHLHQNLTQEEWTPGMVENGLPQVGRPVELLAESFTEDGAHLLLEMPPDPASGDLETPTRRLYSTTTLNTDPQPTIGEEIGMVWQEVDQPGFGRIEGITLGAGGQLWAWSEDKVAVTSDPDAETVDWDVSDALGGRITAVDVNGLGKVLVALETDQGAPTGLFLDREAKVMDTISLPVLPTSITHGMRFDTFVLSGPRGTWGFDALHQKWIDITPKGVGGLQALEMGRGVTQRKLVLGHTKDAIYRWDMFDGESFLPGAPPLEGEGYPSLPHSTITAPYITPQREVVTVRPEEIKDVDVEFGMPAAPNPLDVFFLVDTTSSMQPAINSLRDGIEALAIRLRRELGRGTCFGVGDFKDFDEANALHNDKVYRTHQKLVCEDETVPKLKEGLKELVQAGGGDMPEAVTVGLMQMLTGAGSVNPPVLPGEEAGFHTEAYKVVVLITDDEFKQGGGFPSIADTAHSLKTRGVKVVSIAVRNNDNVDKSKVHMAELAVATDSVAPERGVDCDGDGTFSEGDVNAGEPLICESNGQQPNIGPIIISLLLGVHDPGTMAVKATDPHNVVREPIKGRMADIRDLKREAKIGFGLPVSCTKEQDGEDLLVSLTGSVRAIPVPTARGEILVKCRAVAPPILPKPPVIIEPEPIPPTPPRQPVALALVPPPNPPVQPISNINLNAGFSQQEEQQYQLATVSQGAGEEVQEEEELELAMSGLDKDVSATPVAAFLAVATAMSMATALAHRRRLQRTTRPGYVRIT